MSFSCNNVFNSLFSFQCFDLVLFWFLGCVISFVCPAISRCEHRLNACTWSWHGSHDSLVVGFARCLQAVDIGMPAKTKTRSVCNKGQHVVVVVVVCWDVFVSQTENVSLIGCGHTWCFCTWETGKGSVGKPGDSNGCSYCRWKWRYKTILLVQAEHCVTLVPLRPT